MYQRAARVVHMAVGGFGPARGDEYGYFWGIDLYVYTGFADSGYSDLETGQVIAAFILI